MEGPIRSVAQTGGKVDEVACAGLDRRDLAEPAAAAAAGTVGYRAGSFRKWMSAPFSRARGCNFGKLMPTEVVHGSGSLPVGAIDGFLRA